MLRTLSVILLLFLSFAKAGAYDPPTMGGDHDRGGAGIGLYDHEEQDANYLFKKLGFDFIKVDFCGGDAKQNTEKLTLDEQERYTAIHRAILKTGRHDVRMNICRWGLSRSLGT